MCQTLFTDRKDKSLTLVDTVSAADMCPGSYLSRETTVYRPGGPANPRSPSNEGRSAVPLGLGGGRLGAAGSHLFHTRRKPASETTRERSRRDGARQQLHTLRDPEAINDGSNARLMLRAARRQQASLFSIPCTPASTPLTFKQPSGG